MMKKFKHQKKTFVNTAGFTLIEFIVIISIFAIVASIALFNFSGFSSNISLANLTHDVALAIRGAQVYGISSVGGSNIENPIPHGVAFNFNTGTGEFDREIIIFDDIDGDTFVGPTEIVDTMLMQSSDYISSIQIQQLFSPSSIACTASGGLRILFKRPDPNPKIYCNSFLFARASIEVSSNDNTAQKYIRVEPTGQISIQ